MLKRHEAMLAVVDWKWVAATMSLLGYIATRTNVKDYARDEVTVPVQSRRRDELWKQCLWKQNCNEAHRGRQRLQ